MSSLIIIKPVAITESMLLGTDVPEADHAAWNAATSYAVGDRVIRTTAATHAIYENLVAGINATAPEDALTGATPRWLYVSPTNRWKVFDNSNTSQTTQATSLYYRIAPAQVVNALSLQNVVADTVRIRMIDGATTVYDRTVTLGRGLGTSAWHPWYFSRRPVSDSVTVTDLPNYYGAEIRIDATKTTGSVSIGVILIGYPYTIGLGVQYGAKIGITDYSRKETDDWGVTSFVERDYAKRASISFTLPNTELDATHTLLASLRATPTLLLGSDAYASLQVYGWVGDFDITIQYANYSECSLDFKGLT